MKKLYQMRWYFVRKLYNQRNNRQRQIIFYTVFPNFPTHFEKFGFNEPSLHQIKSLAPFRIRQNEGPLWNYCFMSFIT